MRIQQVYQGVKQLTFEEVFVKINETKESLLIYSPYKNRGEKAEKNYKRFMNYEIINIEFWRGDVIINVYQKQTNLFLR